MEVPSGVQWDLWLGAKTTTPLSLCILPRQLARLLGLRNRGLGDIGCHDMDAAVWALDLRHPTRIEWRPGGKMNEQIAPHSEMVYYDFDRRGASSHRFE